MFVEAVATVRAGPHAITEFAAVMQFPKGSVRNLDRMVQSTIAVARTLELDGAPLIERLQSNLTDPDVWRKDWGGRFKLAVARSLDHGGGPLTDSWYPLGWEMEWGARLRLLELFESEGGQLEALRGLRRRHKTWREGELEGWSIARLRGVRPARPWLPSPFIDIPRGYSNKWPSSGC